MRRRQGSWVALAAMVALGLSACTGIEPVLIGAAASAGQGGAAVWRQGKLNAAFAVNAARALDAGFDALDDLELRVMKVDEPRRGRWAIEAWDERERGYRISVDERTQSLTRVQIDVGLFGSRAVGELILRRMMASLGDGAAEPEASTASRAEPDR